jgi:hypothetical protein
MSLYPGPSWRWVLCQGQVGQAPPDGCVSLLIGKDHDEEPFTVDILLTPNYLNKEVTEPMPSWFLNLLQGPTPTYHALCKAAHDLDNWATISEIECY